MNYRKLYFGGLAMALFLASSANAAIFGTMNITGSVRVDATNIDWIPLAGGTGTFSTIFPATGYFAGIYNPAVSPAYTGTAKDLNSVSQPVGGAIFLDSFLSSFTAPGYGGLTFDLTQIFASNAPVCTGAEGLNTPCAAVAGSPFTLSNTSQGVAVLFSVAGFFQAPGESDAYATGSYTTQLNGRTIASVLQTLGTGGFIDSSYSAEYSAVPEPGTTGLMMAGLGMLAAAARRKRT